MENINNIFYWITYVTMLIAFLTLAMITMPTPREKAIGILITLVNALLFWKG